MLKDVDGVFIVYDITNEESFMNVSRWLLKVAEHAPEKVVTMLIGAKNDLMGKRQVTRDDAKAFAG